MDTIDYGMIHILNQRGVIAKDYSRYFLDKRKKYIGEVSLFKRSKVFCESRKLLNYSITKFVTEFILSSESLQVQVFQ